MNLTRAHDEKPARAGEHSIPRRSHSGPCPLSFAQQRLWFLNQLEPDSPAYNQPKAFRLKGALNIGMLKKALDAIVARHEVLRTAFPSTDGHPVQVIGRFQPVGLPIIDLSGVPDDKREAELERLIIEITQRPFDLSRDLMLRATLLRVTPMEHVLLVVTHHIASDGWSNGVLSQEIVALYKAFSDGCTSPLPDLPIQYADFASWQRQRLQGDVLGTQLSYWKKQLSGIPVLELPTDRPRPPVQTFRGARQSWVIPKILFDDLKALSRRERVTLFMTLIAAFQTLLYRYTGQEDIVVGSPIANRTRPEIERLIGFFVNTLVLRGDLSGNPNFRELLARMRTIALDAYQHQDLPFEKLVEELHPERNLSRTPLFQVMFVSQNAPRASLELPGLTVRPVQINSGTAKFDLTLSMIEESDSLLGLLEYNTDLFEDATIKRMLGHYQRLLEGVVANPEQRLSDLPLLTETEEQQLLIEWNVASSDYPKDKCIHQLFEAQVERTPDAVAVVYENERFTYRELNTRANQLAHYLLKLGVGPEVLVGVCVERSLEMVVGLLSILKAGGAFVPLDPAYPKERIAFMLEDAKVSVLLTQHSLVEALPQHTARVICLDADLQVIAGKSEQNPVGGVMSDNPAYVIYTSGSTAIPKGVLISHSSIAHHCLDIQSHYDLDSNDRVLQFASLNFDTSLEQILPTLITGASLVLKDTEVWSATDFFQKISDLGLTVVNLPTAYWHQLAQAWANATEPPPNNPLELVTAGGETMLPEDVRLWQQTPLSRVGLLNAYGPTETTITATTFKVSSRFFQDTLMQRIPIGRPIGNRRTYILDRNGSPVPIGVPGELHIGGMAIARGYLNRPELTAENFIPDPFSDDPGSRFYKTGDRARYLPDGNIEFLGRLDNQVKIRGFRVELGEIEAALGQHPAVQDAVVLARDETASEKRLIAYVVAKQKPVPDINELRSFLKTKLPDYMVPSAFVFPEALPLMPNGKVDRQTLPAPDKTRPGLEKTFVAPRTQVERLLADVWAEVLGLEEVGVYNNFFDLGGHSLLAMQVISRVRAKFQIELPVRTLFQWPTIAEFASALIQGQSGKEQDLARMVAELEALSDRDAEHLLAEVMLQANKGPTNAPRVPKS